MASQYLSKSRMMSGLQCRKRLWLDIHQPELQEIDADAEFRFALGHDVGRAAQGLWPGGILVEHDDELSKALEQTRELVSQKKKVPVYEATFSARRHSCPRGPADSRRE